MMTKEFGIVLFILLTALWIYLLIEEKISGSVLLGLFIATAVVVCLLYNGGNIQNLIFDYKAGKVLAEMNKINNDMYAKTETVKKIGEELVDMAAFTVTSVGRLAPPNLDGIMLKKRDELRILLKEIGSSEKRIKENSLIIENMVANDLEDKMIQIVAQKIIANRIKASNREVGDVVYQKLRGFFKDHTQQELNQFLEYVKSEGVITTDFKDSLDDYEYFLSHRKLKE